MTDTELRELQRVTLDEVERGQILLVLANAYPRRLTPKVLRYLLKERCYDLDSDKLDFHIEYLREKGGWVSIEGCERSGQARPVRITPAGIDLIDRRKLGETGVVI